jgi:transposase-like protein
MPAGRPTDYTPELAAKICELAQLGKSLSSIAAMEGMPATAAIFQWLRKYPEFAKSYSDAKEDLAEKLAEEITEIADEEPPLKADGEIDPGAAAYRKLRLDARKWNAARLKPKKFGDKIQQEVSGGLSLEQILRSLPQDKPSDPA